MNILQDGGRISLAPYMLGTSARIAIGTGEKPKREGFYTYPKITVK